MQLANKDWYQALVEDCKAIITEAVFNSNWTLIEGYHNLGKRILEENENFEREKIYGKEITSRVSQSLNKSKRTVERALQFVKKYPDINSLPKGKSISWRTIVNELLPDPREIVLPEGFVLPKNVELIHDDFRKVEFEPNSIDLILTDPPYPREFIDLWGGLATFADKYLKPSGFLVAYSGEINLPLVFEQLRNDNLIYYWIICLQHEGPTKLIRPRNLMNKWKPILIYQKKPYRVQDITFQDYIVSEHREKEGHEWQQSESGAKKLIEFFSEPGDLVVDPFSGAGTFPKVAHDLKRRAIGIEIDEHYYKVSKARFNDKK